MKVEKLVTTVQPSSGSSSSASFPIIPIAAGAGAVIILVIIVIALVKRRQKPPAVHPKRENVVSFENPIYNTNRRHSQERQQAHSVLHNDTYADDLYGVPAFEGGANRENPLFSSQEDLTADDFDAVVTSLQGKKNDEYDNPAGSIGKNDDYDQPAPIPGDRDHQTPPGDDYLVAAGEYDRPADANVEGDDEGYLFSEEALPNQQEAQGVSLVAQGGSENKPEASEDEDHYLDVEAGDK
jgi:hypothetical protein